MRTSEVIVVVRTAKEADIAAEAVPPAGAMRRVYVQVAGDKATLTASQLLRMRRAADTRKRRMPVLVWTDREAAAAWRDAGAYVFTGSFNRRIAAKAIEAALKGGLPWVESQNYVGPCRRRHVAWLNRPVRRLADSRMMGSEADRPVENASIGTRLRQLQLAAVGLETADRDRRAQFLSEVKLAIKSADQSRRLHVVGVLDSLVRYLSARGSAGRLDQALITQHLDVAEISAQEAAAWVPRLSRAVDQAIGLSQV